ncbi:hypothetical protein F5Y08DRAFT_353376 [Xylaria arbuscula]|nr:hypothetical protein F5Y08DRAFT_353376 [Xylaria arbuscula]
MCKIIANVTYKCGHTEPWVTPRGCQFDAEGVRKRGKHDPLCLIPGHCWVFGNVRLIKVDDNRQCSACFASKIEKQKGLSKEARATAIAKAKTSAESHSTCAQEHIIEADNKSQLMEVPKSRINKATEVALQQLESSFKDAQMETHHYAELLQIIIGLPFLDKGRLVKRFAALAEKKLTTEDLKWLYELSVKERNFGDYFRQGVCNAEAKFD